ncbi:MAG TPA: hypothetical protein VM888_05900 [Chitinophagaceae bacterium]|jgi:hypothetical protein|nr:hypothetical protein [Chitinophagaceae bacterium]
MKIKCFLLFYLLLSFAFGKTQNDSLFSSWKLVDRKITLVAPVSSFYKRETFKQASLAYHFLNVTTSSKNDVESFSSKMKMNNNIYNKQPVEYTSIRSMLQNNYPANYKTEGNNWYRQGGLDPAKFKKEPYGAELLRSIFFDKPGNFRH